jgi:Ca2+-transporting ATPase
MRSAIALGVAAIPEGLPVVSTAALIRSMQRMRRRGMVVRRVASAETLGGVTVVCADKTGTLTQNDMSLEVIDLGDGPIDPTSVRAMPNKLLSHGPTLVLAAAVLNSDVDVHRNGHSLDIFGSSTERALVMAATEAGLDRGHLRRTYPRRLLRERDSGVHYVISVHDAPDGEAVAFVKGAPEQVLTLCERDLKGHRISAAARKRLCARNEALAAAGLRVLALGWQRLPHDKTDALDSGYTMIGFVGLRDPLRPGSADAIRDAARAGIRTIIVTGDQQRTADAIARAVGLQGETVDGPDVAQLLTQGAAELRARLHRIAVFSRVAPADKVAIVKALRASGEIVAMAGDGINDAPALKAADVGIAIGIGSSDVARQAADVVLENEDLRSILAAVGEGRIVQDNLRRALRFLLATNFSEVALTLGAAIVGAPDPFTPLQLLWVNLLSETLPALALALEPGKPDVLDRAPAPPDAPLLPAPAQRTAIRDGLLLTGLGAAGLVIGGPAVAFSTMVGTNLGYPFACRSTDAAPDRRFFTFIGSGVALQLVALAFPPLRAVLGLPQAFSLLEVGGFAAGIVLPWAGAPAAGDQIIVRYGNGALAPSNLGAAHPSLRRAERERTIATKTRPGRERLAPVPLTAAAVGERLSWR